MGFYGLRSDRIAEFFNKSVVEDRSIITAFDDGKPSAILPSLVIFARFDKKWPLSIRSLGDPLLDKLFMSLASSVLLAVLGGPKDFRGIDITESNPSFIAREYHAEPQIDTEIERVTVDHALNISAILPEIHGFSSLYAQIILTNEVLFTHWVDVFDEFDGVPCSGAV
ncbi:hypothetical protein ACFQPE_17360 [Halomarina halobia]|uniref:Uncharacterized protein n=1 Tax=Halomarina halobia TaxID=3033386 RepID=A0ABD6AE06_9EURY